MDPIIGQIVMFAGTFAPRGWALCNGQRLGIEAHPKLFSLLGTTYGGDGRSDFALPDLRGRVPVHAGAGPGLSPRRLGEELGAEAVALTEAEMPAHGHEVVAANCAPDSDRPGQAMLAQGCGYRAGAPGLAGPTTPLSGATISPSGRGQAHDNMPPALCVNFIIATDGVYPSRG